MRANSYGSVTTSSEPSSCATTSSAPASSAASISLSSSVPGANRSWPQCLKRNATEPVGAHVAAVLGERVAHLGHGARAVVGEQSTITAAPFEAVALVADLLVVHAVEAARAALDRALDVVLGHVVLVRLVDGEPQPRIHVRIAAAHARGDGDFLDEAGEDLAALGVLAALAVLDVRPLAVACHMGLVLLRRVEASGKT